LRPPPTHGSRRRPSAASPTRRSPRGAIRRNGSGAGLERSWRRRRISGRWSRAPSSICTTTSSRPDPPRIHGGGPVNLPTSILIAGTLTIARIVLPPFPPPPPNH